MDFVYVYENTTMKLAEIVLEKEGEGWGRMMEGVNLIRYFVSTYVNVTIIPLYSYYMLINKKTNNQKKYAFNLHWINESKKV
jgi:hypothetical protein